MPDKSLEHWRGGAQIGGSRWRGLWLYWPFVSLMASQEKLVIFVLSRRYVFPRDRIVRLTANYSGGPGPAWRPGLLIEHTVADVPTFVLFRVWFRLDTLAAALRSLGYEVTERR